MNVQHHRHLINGAGVCALLVLSLLGGCWKERHLQADHLPADQYLVGGGVMIEWEAPEDGTVYLVEKQTSKIIETRTLGEGESYSFSVASGAQAKEFEAVLGIDFSEARFLLYFKPAGRQR